MAAAAAAQAQAAAALAAAQANRQNAIKDAMRIPLYHGEAKEDSLTIEAFIDRFEAATASMGALPEADKCNMFGNYLRGKANLTWTESC